MEQYLEFETKYEGYNIRVSYVTGHPLLKTLMAVTLAGYPLDIAELCTDIQYQPIINHIQYAMNNNCTTYWEQQNVAA